MNKKNLLWIVLIAVVLFILLRSRIASAATPTVSATPSTKDRLKNAGISAGEKLLSGGVDVALANLGKLFEPSGPSSMSVSPATGDGSGPAYGGYYNSWANDPANTPVANYEAPAYGGYYQSFSYSDEVNSFGVSEEPTYHGYTGSWGF